MPRLSLGSVAAVAVAMLLFLLTVFTGRTNERLDTPEGRRLQAAPIFADPKTVNSKLPLTGESFEAQIVSLGTQEQVTKLIERHHQELAAIQDLQYQVNMLKARNTAHIAGPMSLGSLSRLEQDRFGEFNVPLRNSGQFLDGTGGKSSVMQVPAIVAQEGLMQRTADGGGWIKEWSSSLIERLVSTVRDGGDISPPDYPGSALQIRQALEDFVVGKFTSPRILVAGSISPWVEAIVLAVTGAHKVWVVDWQEVEIGDPRIECLLMPELSKQRPRELFDIIISFSSIEHDGLGRYGDPLNPEGDLAAMAEFHTLLNPHGIVIVGVPLAGPNRGRIERNDHRMYSPERIKALSTGFTKIEEIKPATQELADRYKVQRSSIHVDPDNWKYQPTLVMKKDSDQLPLVLGRGD